MQQLHKRLNIFYLLVFFGKDSDTLGRALMSFCGQKARLNKALLQSVIARRYASNIFRLLLREKGIHITNKESNNRNILDICIWERQSELIECLIDEPNSGKHKWHLNNLLDSYNNNNNDSNTNTNKLSENRLDIAARSSSYDALKILLNDKISSKYKSIWLNIPSGAEGLNGQMNNNGKFGYGRTANMQTHQVQGSPGSSHGTSLPRAGNAGQPMSTT